MVPCLSRWSVLGGLLLTSSQNSAGSSSLQLCLCSFRLFYVISRLQIPGSDGANTVTNSGRNLTVFSYMYLFIWRWEHGPQVRAAGRSWFSLRHVPGRLAAPSPAEPFHLPQRLLSKDIFPSPCKPQACFHQLAPAAILKKDPVMEQIVVDATLSRPPPFLLLGVLPHMCASHTSSRGVKNTHLKVTYPRAIS